MNHILDETWNQLKLRKARVENNFGEVLVSFDTKATEIFRSHEKKALEKLAKSWLNLQKEEIRKKLEAILTQSGWEKFIKKASQIFVEFGVLVQALEKDLGNEKS